MDFPIKIAGMTEHNDEIDRQQDIRRQERQHQETMNALYSLNSSLQKQITAAKKDARRAKIQSWISLGIAALSMLGTVGAFLFSFFH